MRLARLLAVLAAAPIAVGATGCGDEESGSAAATAPPPATTAEPAATTADAAPAQAATDDLPEFSGELIGGGSFDETMVQADTVIHVFASWCPTCEAEAPEFVAFQREHPDLTYLYVAVGDEPADAQAFLDRHGFAQGRVIDDPDREVARAFGLIGQPNTVFVPASGELVRIAGPAGAEELGEAAAKLRS